MLRIKADRWQDFCNKAEELDFIPHDFEYRHTGYEQIICGESLSIQRALADGAEWGYGRTD